MIAPNAIKEFQPTLGQIWQERGSGMRFVKVLEGPRDWVRIRSCTTAGEFIKGARATLVDARRFRKRFDYCHS